MTAPAAPVRPLRVALVATAFDPAQVRPACQEIYRLLASDPRFRPESRLREALEEQAPIDPHVLRAQQTLQRARAELGRLDYDGAAKTADAALHEALPARPATSGPILAEAATTRGVAEHYLDRREAALESFALALALDPGRTLDPVAYPPQVLARFEEARTRKRPTGRVLVRAEPVAPTVWIDGRVARSPYEVPAGDHVVAFSAPGFEPLAFLRHVDPSPPTELEPYLSRAAVPDQVRDLVAALRAAVRAGLPDEEGRARAELTRLLEVDALLFVSDASGGPGEVDRTAVVSAYDARAARVGERVLETGRKSPRQLADELAELLPRPPQVALSPSPAPTPSPTPTPPPGPGPSVPQPPLYRRWWFLVGLGGILLGGTLAVALLTADTRFNAVVVPQGP